MRYEIFGQHTGLKVSEFVLGTGRLGQTAGGGTDPGEAQRVLAGFAEAGGNFLDTSDAYLGGEAERIIGEFIAPHRADFVVASKFGRTSGRSPSLGALGNTRKAMVSALRRTTDAGFPFYERPGYHVTMTVRGYAYQLKI